MLLQAAAAAAGGQRFAAGALYVVATPIGNLADLTLRAIHLLDLVDAVACEDTRVTGRLLHHLGLDKPLIALHEHNELAASQQVLARLASGERVAYASDAGTPAISDPGAALVAAAAAAGHPVVAIPGASSVVAALSVAGDAQATGFGFHGFLPPKGQERRDALDALLALPGSQVLFEAPHRIHKLIELLAELAPQRQLTICRELTKQFEQVHTLAAADAPGWLAADAQRGRGEFVLVLHAVPAASTAPAAAAEGERVLALLLRELPLKQAVTLAADISGAPRNALYSRALELREG
ncbi:16S rRNA (cytidine(1402)-2'-O)-methyltransferase [Aquincola sp. S2]|uniref:Ribosomal RNA small subunit methyltransferase I n=1 Tax=Pseudaquabacterium terrae TaxID=2732868 RepID=A0ABX2ELI5_9BURK|nr:16S rRNA (cytidine(1402)-2'-O)-methyltransferase [Aquabacterium terrae]NRF69384.1 16S rRNA (cytidine(1402)-2'-O)-methyltransferase [Aquabacterium terrae]